MKRVLLSFFLVAMLSARAQTIEVQGNQTGVWAADTIRVIGDVNVVDSLVINSGTVVLFDGFYGITVFNGASLLARGEANDSIVFTVADTTGFSVYNTGDGGWDGLHLQKAGRVMMEYCLLQYGKAADTLDSSGGAINIIQSNDVEIKNTTFYCNFAREHGGAIHAVDSKVRFEGCAINYNKVYTKDNLFYMYGGGARFLKCDVVMTDMEFLHNDGEITIGGAMCMDSCSVTLDRAVFAYNHGLNGAGFYLLRCNDKECRLSNLLIHDNFSSHFGGGMAFADASPEVYNVTVTRNVSDGVDCTGIFYYMESSPKLYNCIVSGNYLDTFTPVGDTIQQWIWTYNDYGPEFYNCLFENGLAQFTGAQYILAYKDVIDDDPRFVDPEHGNFRLMDDSPCRDAGYAQSPSWLLASVDLDGLPRLANGRIDIGPYEYSPAAVEEAYAYGHDAMLVGNPLGHFSKLIVQHNGTGDIVVRVVSLLGHSIVANTFGGRETGRVELDLGDMVAGLARGPYLLEVITDEKTFTIKAIK